MENNERQKAIEEELIHFPILQFTYLKSDQVKFYDRVRAICEKECPRYGTSWSCPPAVGSVAECQERCSAYSDIFVFSTIAEVNDITNMEETLATRADHEEVTRQVAALFRERYGEILVLSTESCDICEQCAYPNAPCRCPDRMFPCVESYGILVSDLAEQGEMEFQNGANVVTWFSVIFFTD